jgi:hypothetical protein
MANLKALRIVLEQQGYDLMPDVWMVYVNRQCPDPSLHEDTGVCMECDNKFAELEGKDVPLLASMMRLALSSQSLHDQVSS